MPDLKKRTIPGESGYRSASIISSSWSGCILAEGNVDGCFI
jgi:hypothetical protein